ESATKYNNSKVTLLFGMSSANAVTAINNKVSPGDKTGLPWEIWQIILSWLSSKDLCHFAMVCKTWSELVISVDNTRWKELYLQCSEWRHPFWPLNVEAEPPSWRLAYRDQFTATRFWKKRQKYDSKHFSCASIFKRSIRPKNIHVGSGKEFDSLNGALSIVSPYDRIIMHPGIYDEQLEVRAKVPFELIGHGEMGSIILVAGIHQLGSTTRLSNLVLRAPWYTSFIIMISSGFLQLDNCIIENGMICAQNPSTLHVKFCTFRHSSIVLHNMNASIIENCEFSQSKSANIIIEGYPKENKNWTYSFLKERTNSIYHQNRSLHRKKHGLKATTSMSSTLHSSITAKSVTTMYSTQLHGPVGNDPIFDMDEPGASFLNPGLLVPMYLGSQKDVSVGCGDLQSMYQECGSSNAEQLSEKRKNSTKTVTDCSTSGASKPDNNVSSNKNCAQSESASRRNSLLKRGVRRKSMDSHVGFRFDTDDPALIQDKLANQQPGIELESCAKSTTSCNKLRSKFQGRSKSFSAFSQSQRKCRSNQIEPVFLENSGIDSCHKNGSSIPVSSVDRQNLFSTRRVCSETDLSNVSEKVHLINVKEHYWKGNHKHDCKCNSRGTSRGCQEINPVQDKVPLMRSGIRRSQSEEIIEISDDTDDDDQSSINELESAGESIDGADDVQDAISSSTDSSDVNSLDYMNSEDNSSSSEESVIMLPHLQEMYLGHPGLMSSGFSHTTDTDSINSECTRPVPVNISEDLLMSKYVGQIQGCLIHQCRMNHSKAGISVSLQAHVIISECDISNVNYGIRCIQHSKVVILKNKIHHCHTSGIFMRLSSSGLIAGNDIHSNSEAGIDIRKASDPLVQYNQIHHGKRSGIVVLGSGCGQIKKNDIYCNTEAGVYILFGANPIVSENYIYEGRAAGVAVNAAGRGCIIDNVIRGNKWGGVDIRNGSCPLVSGNSIINGVSDGIVVGSGGKGIIENNFISGNGGCGLWLLSAKNLYIHGNQICDSGHCGVMLIDMMSVGIEGLLEQNQFLPNLNHRTYSVNDVNPLFTEPTLPFTTLQYNNIYHNKGQGVMIQIDEDIRLLHNAIHGNQLEGIYMSQRAPVVVKSNSITNNGKSGIVTSEYDQISIIGNGVYNNHLHGVICRNECIIEENDIICHAASAIKVESNGNISVTKNRLGCSSGAAIKGVELSVIKATKNKIYFRGSGEFLVSSGQWSAADNYIVNQTKRQSKSDFSKTDFLSDPHPRPHIPPPPPLTVIPNQNIVQVKKVAPGRFCDQRSKLCSIL
ncbi:F-box only protein 10, partial [Biomphalaria glabrata]